MVGKHARPAGRNRQGGAVPKDKRSVLHQLSTDMIDDSCDSSNPPERPNVLPLQAPSLPKSLPSRDRRFVGWHLELREGRDGPKWTKPPMRDADTHADSTRPETWLTLKQAIDTYHKSQRLEPARRLDGIGITMNGDGLFAVDLDNAYEVETGCPQSWAMPIYMAFKKAGAYIERSPGGSGIRILCRGKKPGDRCSRIYGGGKVEMYGSARFVTLTGHVLHAGDTTAECTPQIEALYHQLWPEPPQEKKQVRQAAPGTESDDELIEKALAATNGQKFRRLFCDGDLSEHGGDESAADAALALILAFWCKRDVERVERLLRQSALRREKYDRAGDNYPLRTAKWACANTTEEYAPSGQNGSHKVNGHPVAAPKGVSGSSGSQSGASTSPWDAPAPLPTLPDVPAFDPWLLPEPFRRRCADVAERKQAPLDFMALPLMSAAAAVVGRRTFIRPWRRDDWSLHPNFWSAVVGRPGTLKTVMQDSALEVSRFLEGQERKRHEEAMRQWKAQDIIRKARGDELRKQIKASVTSGGDNQAELDSLSAELVRHEEEQPPVCRRYIENDPTPEVVVDILSKATGPAKCFLLTRDELTGWFRSLDKQGNESARAIYLETWSGLRNWSQTRIGRGDTYVAEGAVTITGGVQPGPWVAFLSGAKKGGKEDDGMTARFLIAWPDIPREYRMVDRFPDHAAKERVREVFERLDGLDAAGLLDRGAEVDAWDENKERPFFRFTDEAQDLFNRWYAALERRLKSQQLPVAIETVLSKYRGIPPTIALLDHLISEQSGSVGTESLRRGIAWAEYLEQHANRAYSAAVDPKVEAARSLLSHIRAGDIGDEQPDGTITFKRRETYRHGWLGLKTQEEVAPALAVLEEYGWVRAVEEDKPKPGRPSPTFEINPACFTDAAAASAESIVARFEDDTDEIEPADADGEAVF